MINLYKNIITFINKNLYVFLKNIDLNNTNSTDNNDNIQSDKPKRTRNRLTKKLQYSKERT